MSRKNSLSLGLVGLFAVGFLGAAQSASAVVIANWKFDDGAFLTDSSGNGNTLSASGAALDTGNVAPGGSTGSASFDGTDDFMQTIANLDLSGYQAISVTWWQQTPSTVIGVLFEHSPNKNLNPGGFLADVNEVSAGVGLPAITFTGGGSDSETMPHLTNGTWQQFVLTIDLTQPAGSVLTVTGGSPNTSAAPVDPFRDDILYFGARGGSAFFFNGNLDEILIEGTPVPEPSSLAMLLCGSLAMWRLRGRRGQ